MGYTRVSWEILHTSPSDEQNNNPANNSLRNLNILSEIKKKISANPFIRPACVGTSLVDIKLFCVYWGEQFFSLYRIILCQTEVLNTKFAPAIISKNLTSNLNLKIPCLFIFQWREGKTQMGHSFQWSSSHLFYMHNISAFFSHLKH